MPKSKQPLDTFYAQDRAEWRAWLAQNHASAPRIWFIYYKPGSGKPCVAYDDAVEEALCFGWIDSHTKTIDDQHYVQLFTPRKPKSQWSKINKRRIEKLIELGLMTEAGLQKIEAAKGDGSWSRYDSVDALQIPDDLAQALAANETANTYFQAFNNSSKKIILWWIESAQRPQTRQKRIAETVALAAQNIKANHQRR
jgi:uncharacterized protein YdeI (YjbR/CyaY-like superfamily)